MDKSLPAWLTDPSYGSVEIRPDVDRSGRKNSLDCCIQDVMQ